MATTKQQKLASFDPNQVGLSSHQIFGLPFSEAEADVILLPVPWDVTVSYSAGCAGGPQAIREASYQVDLHDPDFPGAWKHGIAMKAVSSEWERRSQELRTKAELYIDFLEQGGDASADPHMQSVVSEINDAGEELRTWVRETTIKALNQGKLVGLVGGDHSTPLGYLDALASIHQSFGILQVDAHCDLREAYEGFKYSHASIMWNALTIPNIEKLVQVGVRDYGRGELEVIQNSRGRVATFFDRDLKRDAYEGRSWKEQCLTIVQALPQKVYLSFDIDGLDPKLCPNTGTPVPGGLEFEQATYLVHTVVLSGRTIVGFDLNEVSPGKTEWDANVGARLLFKLCNFMLKSRVA